MNQRFADNLITVFTDGTLLTDRMENSLPQPIGCLIDFKSMRSNVNKKNYYVIKAWAEETRKEVEEDEKQLKKI